MKREVPNLRNEISNLKILNTSLTLGIPHYKLDGRQRKMSTDLFDNNSGSLSRSDEGSSSTSATTYLPINLATSLKTIDVIQMLAD